MARRYTDKNVTFEKTITYRQSLSASDLFRYVKAVLMPFGVFVLALFVTQSLAGFGTKLVAPMTCLMWVTGVVCALALPSHRSSIMNETHMTIGIYLITLVALKYIISLMSGVSSEMLMAAFNQAIPTTSGSAISGWLQTLMWITAVMTPIGFVGMQGKRLFSFKRKNAKEKTLEGLRGVRDGDGEHQYTEKR